MKVYGLEPEPGGMTRPPRFWSHSHQKGLPPLPARLDYLATKKLPGSAHEIRHFLRASAAAAVERWRRTQAVPGGAGSGRTRGRTRHRLRLGSRTSFPGGVFALLGAGDISRGVFAANQEDPSRPRHLPSAAEIQPPGAGR